MIQLKKRILSFIIIFSVFASSLMLGFAQQVHADSTEEEMIYQTVQQTVWSSMDTEAEAVYGKNLNEWFALELIRDDQDVSPYYLQSLVSTLITNKGVLHTGISNYTNYAKAILVLTAFGIDATNVAGYNLIEKVSLFDEVKKQGVNGIVYALIALDSANYEIEDPYFTRDTYINAIIKNQLEDGGWDYANKQADPDMTAMVIQALAPYYASDENVKTSVDKALQTLSDLQQPDGGFQTEDARYQESSESTSMVILALTALGIDPTKDSRFIKDGNTTIDNLCSFAVDGGFKHTVDGKYNALATDQGYRALIAYHRLKEGKTSFYDMSDVGELRVIFTDVLDPNAWFCETVYTIAATVNQNGNALMSGYKDGSYRFGPADSLTRQDFAVILYRLAEEPKVESVECEFPDADPNGYYFDSVLWAKDNMIITGYEDGRFGVGDNITREQVATILYRYARDYLEADVSAAGDLSSFDDSESISDFAIDALTWANGAGIITGKEEGTRIDPQGNAARAEIGAMILRFIDYIK